MELKHLRSFIALAEELSFHRAAERLNLTQPPLSLQIKSLEEEVGAKLFDRGRNAPVRLTEAGQVFLEGARATLLASENCLDQTRRAIDGQQGSLSIGYTDDFLFGVLPKAIAKYHLDHPDVLLTHTLSTSESLMNRLSKGEFDIVFACLPVYRQEPTMVIKELPPAEIVAVVSDQHCLADKHSISLSNLKQDQFYLTPPSLASGFSNHISRLFAQSGFTPKISGYGFSSIMIAELVAQNVCVSLLSRTSIPNSLEGLAILELEDQNSAIELGIVRQSIKSNRAIADNFVVSFEDCLPS